MNHQVICQECGKIFLTNHSTKKFCDELHYRICEGCGKPFFVDKSRLPSPVKTCSESCRRKVITLNHNKNKPIYQCVCKFCGDSFTSYNLDDICYKEYHTLICTYCHKPFQATRDQVKSGIKTCSQECRYNQRQLTIDKKYGPEGYMTEASIKKQIRSFKQKYGKLENPEGYKKLQAKRELANLKKYGATSFTKTQAFRDKCIRYNQQKYGVDWYMSTDDFKSKSLRTLLDVYGADNISKSEHFYKQIMIDPSKSKEFTLFKSDPEGYIKTKFEFAPTLHDLESKLGVRASSISYTLRTLGLIDLIDLSYSQIETEVFNLVSSLLEPDTLVMRNTFQIITPYELDLFIPSKNFAIECNPTYTHNSTFPTHNGEVKPLDHSYHQMKTSLCDDQLIQLYHLFGYQWEHKQTAVISYITNKLNPQNLVSIQNTKLSFRISEYNNIIQKFISENSIIYYDTSNYLCLYSDEYLVGILLFEISSIYQIKGIVAENTYQHSQIYHELLTYFTEHFADKLTEVTVDRSYDTKSFYEDEGFTFEKVLQPTPILVDIRNDKIVSESFDHSVEVYNSGYFVLRR